jgi:hypothetical protein
MRIYTHAKSPPTEPIRLKTDRSPLVIACASVDCERVWWLLPTYIQLRAEDVGRTNLFLGKTNLFLGKPK